MPLSPVQCGVVVASASTAWGYGDGLPLTLFRRTGAIAVRAEYAAISWQGPEEALAALAFVEMPASTGGHRLGFAVSTDKDR